MFNGENPHEQGGESSKFTGRIVKTNRENSHEQGENPQDQ